MWRVESNLGDHAASRLVTCAGLYSDRVAAMTRGAAGPALDIRIVPFRGEYYELRPDRRPPEWRPRPDVPHHQLKDLRRWFRAGGRVRHAVQRIDELVHRRNDARHGV